MSDNINRRCILQEIHDKMSHDDFRCLSYLSKDVIKNRKRMELRSSLDLFLALEEKTAINCTSQNFSLLEEMFRLMGRKDVISVLTRCKQDAVQAEKTKTSMTDKRILLFNIGEETGEKELNYLKESLGKSGVRKRELDHVTDVWDGLDLLEERIRETDHLSFLRNTLGQVEEIKVLLDDFIQKDEVSEGATGCQSDKFPVQEEGDMEITNGEEAKAYSNMQTGMSMDGFPSGFSSSRWSGLGVYDKGIHPGRCVIINNERFDDESRLPTRTGTNIDRDRLHDMFTMFGFNISMYNNQSRDEVMNVLECVQKEDHQDNGALVVCFLSHGSLNTISGSCGQDIGISNMTSLFRADNCPSMSGKPKFFILQACQGRETQNVWHRGQTTIRAEFDDPRTPSLPEEEVTHESPSWGQLDIAASEADFLVAQSTMPGYISLRDEKEGSFFIQSLVRHLKEHSRREDVVSILVEVNRDVSRRVGKTREGQLAVQIPEPKVRLTKKFYLYPIETEV
ncbi:caspase-3-like isoform X2 [Ostrea edulis]|uniref:caspase-3-like isoform X2 n=1 Tax=Ostrea edulis TaxID=37623 RepID=UPI002094F9C5|nr:caspase-3-like isoform X2 [Ostrea edulis]